MFTEISASLSAIKSAFELAQTINDAKNQAERDKAVHELRHQLTALQIENLQLAQLLSSQYDEIHSLKRELRDVNEIKRNLEAYTIYKTGSGQFIYAIRESLNEENANFHYACPHCYHHGQISILQPVPTTDHDMFHKVHCLQCKNIFSLDHNENYKPLPSIEMIGRLLSSDPSGG
ncbi:DUF3450 domain-containing protein [Salmonella enterica]|uniref:DUF3450 domain-containing protein n=1 Tax=Salmonella enterica TaxID=28901 RepID=A0A5U3IWY4_SALER|nr:DUF3450 domain-containing protein [Salmonella enterica]